MVELYTSPITGLVNLINPFILADVMDNDVLLFNVGLFLYCFLMVDL